MAARGTVIDYGFPPSKGDISHSSILRPLGQQSQGRFIKTFPQRNRSTHRKTPNPFPHGFRLLLSW
jgi:hypothetical protein